MKDKANLQSLLKHKIKVQLIFVLMEAMLRNFV